MSNKNDSIASIRNSLRLLEKFIRQLESDRLSSDFSMPEYRILHELNRSGPCLQSELARALSVDCAYISRIVRQFKSDDIVRPVAHGIEITAHGRSFLDSLNHAMEKRINTFVGSLGDINIENLSTNLSDACKLIYSDKL